MNGPLISVLIPCFNQGQFIGEAVDSVLSQRIGDFEILVVDDGSTDELTRTLLADATWPKTTIFRTENRGLARARNLLIERATGHYLCALDADDRLHRDYFASALAAFERDPSLTFVSSRLQMFGDEHRVTPADLDCSLPTLLTDCPLFPATLVRRSAVVELGGFDANIPGNEDWDLWISLLERGHRGVILPDILFFYRRRRGSLCDTCTRGDTYLEHMRYLMTKHAASYQLHGAAVRTYKTRALEAQRLAVASAERALEARRTALTAAARGDALEQTVTELEAVRREYGKALHEIDALRNSVSWRLTAPLRRTFAHLSVRFPSAARPAAARDRPENADAAASERTQAGIDMELLVSYEEQLLLLRDRHEAVQRETLALQMEEESSGPRSARQNNPAAVAVDFGDLRRSSPISDRWGVDRGRPLDRYYIEDFLRRHQEDIKGRVLEVKDPGYTRLLGRDRVQAIDVLDIDPTNRVATVVADLSDRSGIGRQRYDCFILTQTLGLIYDVRAALTNAADALKPGGVLLCTVPASGRISNEPPGLDGDYWRFTEASVRRLFGEVFSTGTFRVVPYGNVLARAAFEYGVADHELSVSELEVTDPFFPVVYGIRAVRTWP